MTKALVVVASVSSVLVASVAWACGGAPPVPSSPGFPGTTVAERGGTISMFVGNAQGYLWQRVTLADSHTETLGQVPGRFTGSVETDPRVSTGIAGENGKVVSFAANDVSALSDDPLAQVDVFGAALSTDLKWQVFTYDATSQTIAYFKESNPGRFDKAGTLQADCGPVLMLDVAVEDSGAVEGLCGAVSFEVANGNLQTVELPVQPLSLTLGSNGKAIAFGPVAKQGGLQLMRHDASGWVATETLASLPAEVVFALDDKSVLVRHEGGFTAYTSKNGRWNASQKLDKNTLLTSTGGAPAKVFAGDFELTVFSTDGSDNGAWTGTTLGSLGELPNPGSKGSPAGGCTIVGTAIPFALLGLMSMTRFRRRFEKRS